MKLNDNFKKKVKGAFEILCISIINFFGVKLWSRLSIALGLATWLCYTGKISGTEWVAVVVIFTGTDFARSKYLNGSENANGASAVDKITQMLGIKK